MLLSQYDVADPFRGVREGGLDVMIVKFGFPGPRYAGRPTSHAEE